MKKKQVTTAVTPKRGRGRPRKNTLTPVNKKPSVAGKAKAYREHLESEIKELYGFCNEWRAKCDKQESEIARIQHLYMDSQAVVRYLESKIAQLIK